MAKYKDLFDFWYLELIEKLGRLGDFVSESAERAAYKTRGKPRIVQEFEQGIAQEAGRLAKSVVLYLSVRDDEESLSRYSHMLLNDATHASRTFQVDHSRLQRFPADWVPEELYVFVDDVCRGVRWPGKSKFEPISTLGTIALDDRYDFGELNRARWERMRPVATPTGEIKETLFLLPKAEKNNPVAWPMLVHEIGHALLSGDETIGPARETLGKLAKTEIWGPEVAAKWAREIAADLFAADVLGPVYLLAFISLAITMRTHHLMMPTPSHPPPRIRVDYILDRLARLDLGSSGPNMADLNRHLDRLYTRGTLDHEARNRYEELPRGLESSEDIRTAVQRAVEQVICSDGYSALDIPLFGESDYMRALRLVDQRLVELVPIGSFREELHYRPQEIRRKREEAARALSEEPNSISQIVTAAAVYKIRNGLDSLRNIVEPEDGFQSFHRKRRGFDLLVTKSMEMALIHQFYVT